MSLSSSMEDYLEAIYEIEKEKPAVRVRDVAKKLRVTMPSVNGALKNLQALGLIRHHRYEYIELTETGSVQAAKIAARHRIILVFLTGIIGVDEDTAEAEACKMEHVLSAETMEKLTAYIDRMSRNREQTENHENP
ncbi:MAG: metal-dependent transcriptional regulator [Candidatus Latescibacterota bacterium]